MDPYKIISFNLNVQNNNHIKKKPKCINTKNKPNLHPLCRHQQLCRLKMLFHLIGRSYCAPSSEIKNLFI